jgi:hypothetical protein
VLANKPAYPSEDADGGRIKGMTLLQLAAIENHAQLIRFVQRDQMTSKDAAELAVSHACHLMDALKRWENE